MNALPPMSSSRPARRVAPSGAGATLVRFVFVLAVGVVAAILTGCESTAPSPVATAATASSGPPSPPPASPTGDGLLVAAGGPLQVTSGGALVLVDSPSTAAAVVTTASGVIVTADRFDGLLLSQPSGGPRSWSTVTPPGDGGDPRLVGLAPDGSTLAFAVGDLQGRAFQLVLVDLATGERQSIDVARGLDGQPAWIGPSIVAVHAIRADQQSGFSLIDTGAGSVTDITLTGVALASSADGERVAFDDAASGEALVGARTDMTDAGLARLTRLPNPAGTGVERLALSADGRRLAITRRTESGASIEVILEIDGSWQPGGSFLIAGDQPVSIAWLG